jgi:hypothetical protein
MTTKISCGMIGDPCVNELKSAFVYLFDSDTARDAHFAAQPEQLVNDGQRQSMAFIGTTLLAYQHWNGPDRPNTYDNSHWQDIPVSTGVGSDAHYWGDPSIDLSVRARRDPANGYLIFERRVGGQWVEKFSVTDSVTTGSIKFVESMTMPIVQTNELGLYAALVKDSEHGDAWVLRPVFMDAQHNHYMTIAALPNGRLRIPQNVDAALSDPENVPVTYKYVLLEDDGEKIIQAIVNDPTEPKLPAEDIANLTGTHYQESTDPILIDPVNLTYIEFGFTGDTSIIQTMPNIVNCRDGARIMIRNLKTNEALVTLVPANSGQTVSGVSSFVVDPGVSALFVCMKGDDDWHKVADFEHEGGPVTVGVEFDNGIVNVGGVTKINVPTSEIVSKGGGEIDLTPYLTFRNEPSDQFDNLSHQLVVQLPLKTFSDPNVDGGGKLYIDPSAYEPLHKPSFLAYLKETEELIGKIGLTSDLSETVHRDGTLWFDDTVWPAGLYIELARDRKTFGIQEADTLDPNMSGGTDYLVIFRVHMRGVAPEDGFVRAYLYNASVDPFDPTGFLEDKNGNPMAVQRNYKSGEVLDAIEVVGVVNVTGLQEFTCHVVTTFVSDSTEITDRTEGCTGLMIQALTSASKTGLGLLQFEADTGQNIETSSHFLGPDRMSLAFIVSRTESPTVYTAGTNFISTDGWRLINPNGIKIGIADSRLTIEDDGAHIAEFNFGKIFSAEETILTRGKTVDVTVTLINKDNGFFVDMMKWTGAPDAYTPEIFVSRSNDVPVLQPNWVKVDYLFIAEDAVAEDHTHTHTFTVPNDANNYGFVIYPAVAQTPMVLALKQFKADVTPAFTGYVVHAPELMNERHLFFDTRYAAIVADNLGYASFRYTINDADMPMPVGKITKGTANIEIDQTVNQVVGSSNHAYEGAIKFNAEGQAKISTELLVWSEKDSSVVAQTNFWWAKVSQDGTTFTKIDDSELTVGVQGGTKAINTMPTFTVKVDTGDRIALFARTDQTDGAYIESISPNAPMVSTTVTFDELTPDLITDAWAQYRDTEMRVVPFSGVTSQNYTFEIDIPDTIKIGSCAVVNTVTPNTRVSTNGVEFSYNEVTGEMTVHVGTVTTGEIHLTLWR